jgi:hypothetical protein
MIEDNEVASRQIAMLRSGELASLPAGASAVTDIAGVRVVGAQALQARPQQSARQTAAASVR